MTDEEDYGSILDEEEIEVEVQKPVGVVVSVRFSGDEMLALRGAVRESGGMMTSFIRDAVLARVARHQPYRREPQLAEQRGTGGGQGREVRGDHRRAPQLAEQRGTGGGATFYLVLRGSVSARKAGGGQYQTAQISAARVTGLPAVLRGGQPPI